MPVLPLEQFEPALASGARLLGLDLGSKVIGIAISDPGRTVASPLANLDRRKFSQDAVAIEEIVAARGIGGLVVGLPMALDGTEGPASQSARQFARNFLARRDLPVLLWDERFSTAAIERFLVEEVDMSRKRRGEVVDKLAAAYILQGALDALANRRG